METRVGACFPPRHAEGERTTVSASVALLLAGWCDGGERCTETRARPHSIRLEALPHGFARARGRGSHSPLLFVSPSTLRSYRCAAYPAMCIQGRRATRIHGPFFRRPWLRTVRPELEDGDPHASSVFRAPLSSSVVQATDGCLMPHSASDREAVGWKMLLEGSLDSNKRVHLPAACETRRRAMEETARGGKGGRSAAADLFFVALRCPCAVAYKRGAAEKTPAGRGSCSGGKRGVGPYGSQPDSSSSPFRLRLTEADARAGQESGGADRSPIWSDEEDERRIRSRQPCRFQSQFVKSEQAEIAAAEPLTGAHLAVELHAACSCRAELPHGSSQQPGIKPGVLPDGKDLSLTPRSRIAGAGHRGHSRSVAARYSADVAACAEQARQDHSAHAEFERRRLKSDCIDITHPLLRQRSMLPWLSLCDAGSVAFLFVRSLRASAPAAVSRGVSFALPRAPRPPSTGVHANRRSRGRQAHSCVRSNMQTAPLAPTLLRMPTSVGTPGTSQQRTMRTLDGGMLIHGRGPFSRTSAMLTSRG